MLRADGTIMQNKYGMKMIEWSRGTNRTEGHHKNITTTYGTWNAGKEMSDCLLREKRHQHNHDVALARRSGYPRTGHSDTWLDEEYQRLVGKIMDFASTLDFATLAIINRQMRASTQLHYKPKD